MRIFYDTPEGIKQHITSFYEDLFGGALDDLPPWAHFRREPEEWEDIEDLNTQLMRSVLMDFSQGKTAATDLLVVEMLQALPDDVLAVIVICLKDRILNRQREEDRDVWDNAVANLIGKVAKPTKKSQYRLITIIAVLAKVYNKIIQTLASKYMTPIANHQVAFIRKHQPHEIIYILRSLVEQSLEWDTHIWITDGDIKKTYDYTKHSVALNG